MTETIDTLESRYNKIALAHEAGKTPFDTFVHKVDTLLYHARQHGDEAWLLFLEARLGIENNQFDKSSRQLSTALESVDRDREPALFARLTYWMFYIQLKSGNAMRAAELHDQLTAFVLASKRRAPVDIYTLMEWQWVQENPYRLLESVIRFSKTIDETEESERSNQLLRLYRSAARRLRDHGYDEIAYWLLDQGWRTIPIEVAHSAVGVRFFLLFAELEKKVGNPVHSLATLELAKSLSADDFQEAKQRGNEERERALELYRYTLRLYAARSFEFGWHRLALRAYKVLFDLHAIESKSNVVHHAGDVVNFCFMLGRKKLRFTRKYHRIALDALADLDRLDDTEIGELVKNARTYLGSQTI